MYYARIAIDNIQYIIKDKASTIVVINGLATTAGSRWNFLAIRGKIQPTNLAIITVQNSAIEITKHLINV